MEIHRKNQPLLKLMIVIFLPQFFYKLKKILVFLCKKNLRKSIYKMDFFQIYYEKKKYFFLETGGVHQMLNIFQLSLVLDFLKIDRLFLPFLW